MRLGRVGGKSQNYCGWNAVARNRNKGRRIACMCVRIDGAEWDDGTHEKCTRLRTLLSRLNRDTRRTVKLEMARIVV